MNAPLPAKQGRRRLLPTSLIGAILSGHSVLGLAISALIYLICLSGTIVVFAQELERWEQPAGPVLTTVSPDAIDRGLSEIHAKAGSAVRAISVLLPRSATPRLVFVGGSVEGEGNQWVADRGGRLIAPVSHPITDFLVALHANLHLPRLAGLAVVGLIGVALLALLMSGVLAHPHIFREAFTLRRGGSLRVQEADLHNRLGTWGMPFFILVTLTGAVLGAFLLMFGGMAATAYKGDFRRALTEIVGPLEGREDKTSAAMPSVAPIMAFMRAQEPAAQIQSIEIQHPSTRGQTISVIFEEAGRLTHDQRYIFDADSQVIFSPRTEPRSIGSRALLSLPPLHFGWFGGLATKIAYGVLGLALCVVTSSGMTIWFARRRDQGRPVPAWERFWAATAWGQPAIFAFTAVISLAGAGDHALFAWMVLTGLAYGTAGIALPVAVFEAAFRWSAAALMAALAIMHVINWGGDAQDPVAWAIDAAILVGAALIAASAMSAKRS